MTDAATNSAPTRITPGLAGVPTDVDVVVIGLGITGAGVALDAVTRGLSVLAVDAHDLAFGTSRWSSKLVHGGLRYLASGQVGVAHESAVERGILMEVTAPHLTHAIPTLMPFGSDVPRHQAVAARGATWAGDLLRRGARTSVETLPRPRHLSRTEALQLAPSLRRKGLRGAMLGWDGQLEDDARLVTTVARTAAAHGAHVRTRARVALGDRDVGAAARRAHRRHPRRLRAHGRQRHGGLGGRPRRGGPAAAQPRHPPRAEGGDAPRPAGRRSSRPSPAPSTGSCSCSPSPTAPSTSA